MTVPFVTIAIPCLDEEAYIETCIRTIQEQTYPAERMEILIADGGSTDRTLEILARIAAADPRVRTIHNPRKLQAAGMNELIPLARGEIIMRMDVHAEYAADYVAACVRVLDETGADNVGGAARAKSRTAFQRVLCAALQSPLGVGGSKYRSAENEGFVETVFLGAFRRSVFERAGLYDPGAITNEDAELNQRLTDSGGKVYLSRQIVVHYFPRDSYRSLARQYFKYGSGRARTLLKHGKLRSLRPAIPALMVTGGLGLLATSLVQPFTLPLFALYGAAVTVEAVRVGLREGPLAVPMVAVIFPTLHVAHGTGFLVGLVKYGLAPDWKSDDRLASSTAAS